MVTVRIEGKNFSLDDGTICFFTWKAEPGASKWRINMGAGGNPTLPVVKESDKPEIEVALARIPRAKRGSVAMLVINPPMACLLHLDGVIVADHLRRAKEHDGVVDLEDVQIGGYRLTVRVSATADGLTIADSRGRAV